MFIKKITLENFRTFYGHHEINFSTDEEKPVTILIGDNGAGKTNLLNAVYWAFTGDFTKQFNKLDPIINKTAIGEKKKTCSVEIEFTNNNKSYLLRRIYTQGLSETEISVNEYRSTGSLTPMNDELAKTFIEQLIPRKLASWFIFDGEAIGQLHLDGDSKFRTDIRQTFGFSALERLLSTLTEIERGYIRKESDSGDNEELNGLTSLIERHEEDLQRYEANVVKLKETIHLNEKKRADANSRLSQYAQAEPIQGRKERAERKLSEAESRRKQSIKRRNEYFIEAMPKVLLEGRLEGLIDVLNQKEEEQTLPSPFGTKLIEDIKQLKKCICGTSVLPGSAEEKHLDDLCEKASTSQLLQKIFSFRAEIGEYAKQAKKFDPSIAFHDEEIGKCETDIAEQKQIIKRANEEIDGIDNTEVRKLKQEIAEAEGILSNANQEWGSARTNIDRLKGKIPELRIQQDNILAQQKQTASLRAERQKVSKLKTYVAGQFQRQESEVLDALNKEISGVLEAYLTKNFTAKVEPDTYAVKVYDSDGKIASLSTGESNVLKFAVIAAIVGMAGRRTKISQVEWISEPIIAPLIFDAPFSVVDSEYRSGITKNLSELASQLVLMFDGDKWGDKLSSILESKIGKSYLLVSRAKGPKKSISKTIDIHGKLFALNEYGDRDESVIKEVAL
ncbi:AAA family ATPase [Polynucleobacter sp.]|uniref:AAA family ATPase n=1 Tax=Polynucleobacter sp. TaxID=2029855 RepID=UPI0027369B18|nr:AAA family ATPase [Polynucleobacter sp.]MDP3122401.1 AAA family ATPase [Polynucleobacter sp.]